MAAADVSAVAVPLSGYNLSASADFTALTPGAGEGAIFTYASRLLLVLKNATAGPAVFTLKLKTFDDLSDYSVTPSDPTITVAAGETHVVKLGDAIVNSNGEVTVECDVAGSVLVLSH